MRASAWYTHCRDTEGNKQKHGISDSTVLSRPRFNDPFTVLGSEADVHDISISFRCFDLDYPLKLLECWSQHAPGVNKASR